MKDYKHLTANYKPLDDLEMHDLMRLLYPEHIKSDDDKYFYLSESICESTTVDLGNGFQPRLADLLGRLVMLTSPVSGGMRGQLSHCFGEIRIHGGSVDIIAAVRRDAKAEGGGSHD